MDGSGDTPFESSQHGENNPGVHVAKVARRKKGPRQIVESIHVSTMRSAYNQHFAIYSRDKKQVTQLIPNAVWKAVYSKFKEEHPKSQFQEETLKERLRDSLRELKTGTSNEEGSEKVTRQNEEVLTRLKSTDGHVTHNVLKRRQSLIDVMASPTLPSIPARSLAPSTSPGPCSASTPLEKTRTKAQMLQVQLRSIERMATTMETDFVSRLAVMEHHSTMMEQRSALMEAKMKISLGKANAIKINNLKVARDLEVISDEEFKTRVKQVLEL